MSPLEAHIRDLISRYLIGDITASQLYDQVPGPWDVDERADPGASGISAFVIGCLSGYQAGDATAGTVQRLLADRISTTSIVLGHAQYPAVASSAMATAPPFALPVVGTPA